MNVAQIHLALVHFPVILIPTALITFLIAWKLKNEGIKNYSYILFILAAMIAVPAFLTGEPTEEMIEDYPQVSEKVIGEHEEAAELSIFVISFAGIIALANLLLQQNAKYSKAMNVLLLASSSLATVSLINTAHLGGLIRHSEIGSSVISTQSNEGIDESDEEEDDED